MEQIVFEQVIHPVVKFLTSHITKHLGYATCSTKHVNTMAKKMEALEVKRIEVYEDMETNKIGNKKIPDRVPTWLREVENVKKDVESISSNAIRFLHMKKRYRAGRNAFKATEKIERLINEEKEIKWSDANVPLGRVASRSTSTSAPPPSGEITQNDFKSRERIFRDALKFLQQDDKASQVIALCGMGGVGKTTMMEQLKKVARDNKMFDWIVKVVIGRNPNMLSVQNDIAAYIQVVLPKGSKTVKADHLCKSFENLSQAKKTILLILDDVWKKIELKDIGLTSRLPNGFKLLLTSRDYNICKQIAVDANSDLQVVKIDVLEEVEAQNFFSGITGVSEEYDRDLYHIGCDIVKKCGRLPLAIKLIASTLKSQEDYVWRDTYTHLKNNDFDDNVQKIIRISYECIEKQEDKEIFLYCGLFPEDSDIPIEDLMRHAWGLKLLKNVSTLREARDRLNTCARNLINANLLINGDHLGYVKMHDLVLAFVLGEVSKDDRAWIINHGDVSKWDGDQLSKSCKRISLTCKDMSEFPRDFKYPNVSLLKLMHGDLSLMFPEDFYENMENLKVIAYDEMQYPHLPRSPQCYTNLKSLCLHECRLMFDCSFIGDLVNLEVLSFAGSCIQALPSTIGNLTKLKLLDLTGCINLHIDDGVFKKLKNLEELYTIVSYYKAFSFTAANFEELEVLSSQLCALEVEFEEKNPELKKFSFTKLYKFKIAIGCLLKQYGNDDYSFQAILKLVSDTGNDLLDFKISELFNKTEKLSLQVKDMISLQDVSHHSYDHHSFCNLRDLEVYDCINLKYLFPVCVASGLKKLERLEISYCYALEALVHDDRSEVNSVGEMIKFEKLKVLSLKMLPKLICLFLVENVVELPHLVELEIDGLPNFTSFYLDNSNSSELQQPLFNRQQVNIAKLEKLKVFRMEKLKQIWARSSEEEVNNTSMLREINVDECDSLVNLFPTNPMRLLNHLETLEVSKCGSIEVIFNIDLEYVGHEVEQVSKSRLKSIQLFLLDKVREVWRIKGNEDNASRILIHGFEAIETIRILSCEMFRNVFTPINTKIDMRALEKILISGCGRNVELDKNKQEEEVECLSRKERDGSVAFPSILMHTFHSIRDLDLRDYKGVEVVFEIESSQQPLLPNLQHLKLSDVSRMSHVWKCTNWNEFLILQKQSAFHNLTTIKISYCNKIKYLFSPLMAQLLSNLKTILIYSCDGMEEVISNRDDNDEEMTTSTTTNFFPHLRSLSFQGLKNLKRIDGGGFHDEFEFVSSSLCQYSKEIYISYCRGLSSVVPSYAVGQMQKLQVLRVEDCKSLTEVFETEGIDNIDSCDYSSSTNIDEENGGTGPTSTTLAITKLKNISVPQLSNLRKLVIAHCDLLQYVFTFSTLESLRELKELTIQECNTMKMIVKEENVEQTMRSKVVMFPRLESLELISLPNVTGFFLGMNDFQWLLLEYVMIFKCPQMMVFTFGESIAPKLKYIHTSLGKHSIECGLNFHVMTDMHQTLLPTLESQSFERLPWSFHNLIEIDLKNDNEAKNIIPSNELLQLEMLERIQVGFCGDVEEVFEVEAMEGTTQTVVQIPNLTHIELQSLSRLMYIWKSNHHDHMRTILNFPNLKTLSIDRCFNLEHVFTSSMVGSLVNLLNLHVSSCDYMQVIVRAEKSELEGTNSESQTVVQVPNLTRLELKSLERLKYIWKRSHHVLKFPNLTTLSIDDCDRLKHVFTSSMVGSLLQVRDLHIRDCQYLGVIVKEEIEESECDAKVKEMVTLPCLMSLKLEKLYSLKGFFLGNDDFSCPLLHTLEIIECPKITVFTKGHLATPALNVIDTSFGRYHIREGINSFIKTKQHEGFQF